MVLFKAAGKKREIPGSIRPIIKETHTHTLNLAELHGGVTLESMTGV